MNICFQFLASLIICFCIIACNTAPFNKSENNSMQAKNSIISNEEIITSIKLKFFADESEVLHNFSLFLETERIIYFLGNIQHKNSDMSSLQLFEYDKETSEIKKSLSSDVLDNANGEIIMVNDSYFIWIPFTYKGIPTGSKKIYLVNLENANVEEVASLSDGHTLNGADPCSRFSYVSEIGLNDTVLTYAIYSTDLLNEKYGEPCRTFFSYKEQVDVASESLERKVGLDLSTIFGN